MLAACLGSDLWTVGSQAPWQHGPAALALVTAIWLLQPQPTSRRRLALAGLATAVLFTCRMMDVSLRRGHRGLARVDAPAWSFLVLAGPDSGRAGLARL